MGYMKVFIMSMLYYKHIPFLRDMEILYDSFHFHFVFLYFFLGIAIGGDVFPGSTLSDHVLRYQNIPQV